MLQNTQPGTPVYKGKEAYFEAGADFVITSLAELRELISMINSGLEFHKAEPCKKKMVL
jgi:hypothetical protein